VQQRTGLGGIEQLLSQIEQCSQRWNLAQQLVGMKILDRFETDFDRSTPHRQLQFGFEPSHHGLQVVAIHWPHWAIRQSNHLTSIGAAA
jgi:hypothetical protein